MGFEQIILETQGQVGLVTLNRPEKLNAWTATMSRELSEAMVECHENDDIRAVVITGAGRAFCAGADISGGEQGFTPSEDRNPTFDKFWPYMVCKPVIVAINGHAVGVGMTYPMLADVRLAPEDAKLGFAMVRRGILPELASHITVSQVAGLANAGDLLLTGRLITGQKAAEMGIINECLPKEQILDRAFEIANDIAANTAPVSVALAKKLLWEGIADRIPNMMEKEGKIIRWLVSSKDVKEGVQAFFEKRQPEWQMSPSKDIPASF